MCRAILRGLILVAVLAGCNESPAAPTSSTTVADAVQDGQPLPLASPTIDYGPLVEPGTDRAVRRIAAGPRPSTPPWLFRVAERQRQRAADHGARQDLRFVDGQAMSGITFEHRTTPDSASHFRANQYDHGNGVAAADVDSDGRSDLLFVNQVGPNGLWRNLGDGRFEDLTAGAGIGLADRIKSSAGFADLDNDGDPDLVVTAIRSSNALLANRGDGTFENVTEGSGLEYDGHSSAVDFFDYDHDGLLDVFVSNLGRFTSETTAAAPLDPFTPDSTEAIEYYTGRTDAFFLQFQPALDEPSRLYRNLGNMRFEDVTESAGLIKDGWNGDTIPTDVNEDGWTDLYLLNMQGEDSYFENRQGGGFVDRSRELFPKTPYGSTGGAVLDIENDGRQDLLVVDMHSDMNQDVSPELDEEKAQVPEQVRSDPSAARMISGNALFRRVNPDQFNEVSESLGVETMWPWGASVGDLNADGFEDAYLTAGMNAGFRYHPDNVLLNDHGKSFFHGESVLGIDLPADGAVYQPWFTSDCAKDPASLLCDGTGFSGEVMAWEAKGSRGSVILDLEGDGDLDVVTNAWNGPPRVLVSNLSEMDGVNWIGVELEGVASNRDGTGAVVIVESGDSAYTQTSDGQSGYLAQSALPLYFGLGEAKTVDRILVRWPSGIEQTVSGPLEQGILVTVREEGTPPEG